jgi:hypothetical protein
MSSVPLKRVGGIGRAASIVVATTASLSVIAVAATRLVVDDAEAFLDDEISRTEFLEAATPYALLSFLQALSLLASAVLVIVWMHRIARNLRTLHRGTTWGPGWAIGGWFAPPILFVIPFLALREMWKASDPSVPVGGSWRSGPVSPVVTAWFVVFGPVAAALQVAQLGDTFSGLGGSEDALAEQVTGSMTIPVIAAVADVVAAVLFVVLARRLTARHRRLTGEDRG